MVEDTGGIKNTMAPVTTSTVMAMVTATKAAGNSKEITTQLETNTGGKNISVASTEKHTTGDKNPNRYFR